MTEVQGIWIWGTGRKGRLLDGGFADLQLLVLLETTMTTISGSCHAQTAFVAGMLGSAPCMQHQISRGINGRRAREPGYTEIVSNRPGVLDAKPPKLCEARLHLRASHKPPPRLEGHMLLATSCDLKFWCWLARAAGPVCVVLSSLMLLA